MTADIQIKTQYEDILTKYRRLTKLSFYEKTISTSGRVLQTIYESKLYICTISLDCFLSEMSITWMLYESIRNGSRKNTPDPLLALCFYSSSLEEIIDLYKDKKNKTEEMDVTLSLFEKNKWVLESCDWPNDPKFLAAIEAADKWSYGQFRALEKWEYEKYMCSYKEGAHICELKL